MYYDGGRKKGILFWIVLIAVFIGILNTPFFKKGKALHNFGIFADNVSYPFKVIGSAVWNGTRASFANFFFIKGVQKENNQLKIEMEELKAKQVLFETLANENKILKAALSFRSKYSLRVMSAEIIGRSSSNWFEVIEINRGSEDKIVSDTAVINDEGLVGRVFEVSKYSSKVLLLTDPTSAVSVLDASTLDMGIASGNSIGPISVRYMPATANIKVGDRMITSGMSEIFPKGILIGTVRAISKKDHDIFQKVDVDPAVNFSRLDKVFVVVK